MLANNNHKVISRMALRVMRRNKRRYGILAAAVVTASFMVFATLTVGETYFKMKQVESLRNSGADYDAVVVGGIEEEQKNMCLEQSSVAAAGMTDYSGYCVSGERAALVWGDEEYWEQLKKPALVELAGEYPKKADELMVNTEIMEKSGLGDLGIGDSFVLTYEDNQGVHTEEFRISGTFSEYGNEKVFYVSTEFYKRSGYKLAYDGMLYVKFRYPILLNHTQRALEESLKLNKRQSFIIKAEMERSLGIFAGLTSLVLFTCLSAWLLIYNILYLSVSGNIRYYGLMQAVGMTEEQMRLFWKKQMFCIGAGGTAGGLLLGAGVSFLLLPEVIKGLGVREKNVEMAFHPAVLLLSVLLTGLTVYFGSRKAVKTASLATPAEAMKYHNYTVLTPDGVRYKKSKGPLMWRLAWRQFCQDKKKSAIVTLSLAAGLSVFLCMTVLIESHGRRTVFSNYMDSDMEIRNETLYNEDEKKWTQIMDTSFLQSLAHNEGIDRIDILLSAKIIVPWEPEFADMWMREYYDVWIYYQTYDEVVEEYKKNPRDFYSYVKGIDETEFDYLNATLENPVDRKEFQSGAACILYSSGLSLNMDMLKGKHVTYYPDEENDSPHRMKIAGLTEEGYYGGIQGKAPVIIVSDAFLRQITDEPYVCKANIHYREGQEAETEKKIKETIEGSPYAQAFTYDSKLERLEKAEKAQGNIKIVGLGIILILVCIGLINYVNTVTANIQNRQGVFDIMESIGMTGRQLRTMLVLEGLMFAAGTIMITATAGVAVTYLTYQSMNYMDYSFRIPALPAAGGALVSLALCIAVPLAVCGLRDREKNRRQYR